MNICQQVKCLRDYVMSRHYTYVIEYNWMWCYPEKKKQKKKKKRTQ